MAINLFVINIITTNIIQNLVKSTLLYIMLHNMCAIKDIVWTPGKHKYPFFTCYSYKWIVPITYVTSENLVDNPDNLPIHWLRSEMGKTFIKSQLLFSTT